MPHEIHTSERRSFRGCRRRWNWAYREGYVPDVTPKPLEFGIAYHEALEQFFLPERWVDTTAQEKLSFSVEKFHEITSAQQERYLTLTNQRELEVAQGDDYQQRIELGIGMLVYYATQVHPVADNWFRPVATEIPFEVPLEDSDNPGQVLKCTNSPACGQVHGNDPSLPESDVVYSGRVDMLVEDIRNGGYFIWDHKTASQLTYDDGFLQLDDQVGSYAWALSSILGLDIRGFVYAEYRKAYPQPPILLKNGKTFSVNKQQATTHKIFLETVMEIDPEGYEAGKYSDYIAFLQSKDAPRYHQRFVIIKTEKELAGVGEALTIESADIVDPRLRVYPSVGKFSCGNCAYRQPCLAKMMSEDYQYTLDSLFKKVGPRDYSK